MKGRTRLRVGRGEDCEIRLEDDTVSRRHAHIERLADGRLRVTDLGSSNGTWRQESGQWRRFEQAVIEAADDIRFGELRVDLQGLLAEFPPLAVVLGEGAEGDIVELSDRTAEERLERPRRNPSTGDIEEQS